MLSRVADSLYWMSRYLERAEHTTRLLDVNLNLMLDESPTSSDHRWLRMLTALGNPKRRQVERQSLRARPQPHLRHLQQILGRLLHHRRARKRPPGPRADLHRTVAAPQLLYIEVTRPEIKRAMQIEANAESGEGPPPSSSR